MEFLVGIVAIVCVFGFIPAIIWILANARAKREVQATLRASIEAGNPLTPEAIEALTRTSVTAPSAAKDIRTGVIWIAVGVGLGVMGFFAGYMEADVFHPALGVASIPTVIGLAYIALSFFNPNKGKSA